jgi:DNA-damage-inducible protein J
MTKTKTVTVRARVDSKLKADAEAVLKTLGLTASDAIRMFYGQVATRKGLPFKAKVPNAETRRAMRDVMEGRNLLGPFKDTDQMFRELGVSTCPPRTNSKSGRPRRSTGT